MRKRLVFLLASGALAVGFTSGSQRGHDVPFDGYWWKAATPSEKLLYVFGWEAGVNQGELSGCQNALLPDTNAVQACVKSGFMNKITSGPSAPTMGQMVALADRYYEDPKHAADAPSNALANALWDAYKRNQYPQ
jgi:hypothetical protein